MDVTSLYTNIPHDEGIRACEEFVKTHSLHQNLSNDIGPIVNFILSNNYFSFNNKFYLQVNGTAMGTKMAPCYANIFMHRLEQDLLSAFPKKPLHYCRYIDDVFFFWPHGEDSFELFKEHANSFHKSIKFTFQKSTTEIAFLDVLVKLSGSLLTTSVYYKPTDTHMYLHFNSFHPKSLKYSIVYSQCLRLKRICSDPVDLDRQISRMAGFFLTAGYPLSVIKKQITRAKQAKRSDLLQYQKKGPNTRIPFVTTYHPSVKCLMNTQQTHNIFITFFNGRIKSV